jgi:geranylgeranyl diphosphate synthase type I
MTSIDHNTWLSRIEKEIELYSEQLERSTTHEYGELPRDVTHVFCELLRRGGKRLRGIVAIQSYLMFGGKDEQTAVRLALAIEMLHAYILMVDDIQDRSSTRRGGPTAHVMLAGYHAEHGWHDDGAHIGMVLALNSLLIGAHTALNVLTDLDLSSDKKVAMIHSVNSHFITTAHGQTLDIFSEVGINVDTETVETVMRWKTAYYTFLNPLELGALAAGCSEHDRELLKEFSLHAGRAFQITDDIIGIFGNEEQTGKSIMSDVVEGKRTILMLFALDRVESSTKEFIESCLGNRHLTKDQFHELRQILISTGALVNAKRQAQLSVDKAISVLNSSPTTWNYHNRQALEALVAGLIDRQS